MSDSKPIRNQIRDEELKGFFENHGQNSSTKPWQRADWSEKRSEVLAESCEWCGSTEDLTVHHEQESPEWWKVWDETRDTLFENSNYYDSSRYNKSDEVCPRCSKKGFYHRSTMEPAFRCQQCNHEFDEPGERPIPDRRHDTYWDDMNDFVESQRDEITTEFSKRYSDHWDSYLELDNTVTICKACHFAWHENNQRICIRCTENYTQYRRSYQDYVCWECVVDEKGLKQCPKCEDKWYNPDHNGLCKNCRIQLQGICPECREYISTNNGAVKKHLVGAHDWTEELARRAAGPVPGDSPIPPKSTSACPECEKPLQSNRQLITHLVDTHDWSRIEARKSTIQ